MRSPGQRIQRLVRQYFEPAAERLALALGVCLLLVVSLEAQEKYVAVLTGLGGLAEYEENFVKWSDNLETLFLEQGATLRKLDGRQLPKDTILQSLQELSSQVGSSDEMWVFLVGHGTHDGRVYKFNIRGPDITDKDLLTVLPKSPARVIVVAATSASGTLAEELAASGRVIVTATGSGSERQPPLFLSFLLEATASAEADSDKNGKVSVLEAYRFTQHQVEAWFEERKRLRTEHALLVDDAAVRLEAKSEEAPDVPLLASIAYLSSPPERSYRTLQAQQLAGVRQGVEREIESLKFRKKELSNSDYYAELEGLLVRLAKLNQEITELESAP